MYDVIVIGAGVIGASVARELARYKAKVLMIDKENDVGNVTSNSFESKSNIEFPSTLYFALFVPGFGS